MTAPRMTVIGAGISGLAAAHRLHQRLGAGRVRVLDRSGRIGGKISTIRRDGFVVEEGPDSFLATKPEGMALCRELGIEERLIGTLPASPRGYVRRQNGLYPIPEGMSGLVPARLRGLLASRVLSVPGKMRLCAERLMPARAAPGDESIGTFVRRRFGTEAYERLLEPLLGGIYAGDGDALSLAATFPQLGAMEAQHGSVLRAMAHQGATPVGAPRSAFVSFADGMVELVEALERAMPGVAIDRSTTVRRVRRQDGRFLVEVDGTEPWECDGVIVALPAHEAAVILRGLDGELADALGGIPHVSSATVTLGFRRTELAGRVPSGHGFLSPRTEGGAIVAWTFVDHKYRDRAPEGIALLRAFIGRSGAEVPPGTSEASLIALARADLHHTLGVHAEPVLAHVAPWPAGLPQYTMAHRERLATIEARAAAHRGLTFAGASYRGVGIPDCIKSGWQAAALCQEMMA